jgi:hypothetical protein
MAGICISRLGEIALRNTKDILKKPEDFPSEDFQEIAGMIGTDNAVKLMDRFAGNTIYVPKKHHRNIIKKILGTPGDISEKLGIGRSTVYRRKK